MSQPVVESRDEDSVEAAGTAVATFFSFVLFLGGLALLAISFDVGDAGPWTFTGGILAVGLAFALPTTILPALEDRQGS